jgi:recombination protein RecR
LIFVKTAQPFESLVQALQALPAIGPKTALRLASHLLQHDRPAAQLLAHSLSTALGSLRNCCRCNSFTDQVLPQTQAQATAYRSSTHPSQSPATNNTAETKADSSSNSGSNSGLDLDLDSNAAHVAAWQSICTTCSDPLRDTTTLCVVDSIADQSTIEQTLGYTGLYFVLMGRLSPLDGMGAGTIALQALLARAGEPQVAEVILASRFSADGEATAHVIAKHIKPLGKQVSRLAKGVPVGVELEYVDLPTLAHALRERRGQ